MRAVEAGSPKAEAFIAMVAVAIRDMAFEAEKDEPAQAQTLEEMMQRLTDRRSQFTPPDRRLRFAAPAPRPLPHPD